jgi:hypothetical protein
LFFILAEGALDLLLVFCRLLVGVLVIVRVGLEGVFFVNKSGLEVLEGNPLVEVRLGVLGVVVVVHSHLNLFLTIQINN